ncbi:MAG TPA: DNA-binding domain-containing protein [Candidatus Angelobacter sp.]|nr:DNA-binding domain-containing protein [Candidatus Angelobacter sp.]
MSAGNVNPGRMHGGHLDLEQLQRAVFDVVRQPLTEDERMREQTLDGRSTKEIAEQIVKPNDRLTSVERLEIYNRVYWFRLLSSLADDFPGLRAVIGQEAFDKVLLGYLTEMPSVSYTLRDLGSRLETWLRAHPEFIAGNERMALDMVRLEWADIEAFDAAEFPVLTQAELANLGEDPVFHLQPYLQLLDLAYPVDELLLKVRETEEPETDISSNVVMMDHSESVPLKQLPLPKSKKVFLAVHRQENIVYFKRLKPEGFALLRALQQGQPLSQAIETSVNWSGRKLERVMEQLHDWFANWSQLGWFCRPPEEESQS